MKYSNIKITKTHKHNIDIFLKPSLSVLDELLWLALRKWDLKKEDLTSHKMRY